MVPVSIDTAYELAVKDVKDSPLESGLKEDLIQQLTSSKNSTNGISHDQKLQACCENQFHMTRMISHILINQARERPTTRLDVIVQCKWQVVIICAFVTTALVFRPQLAELFRLFSQQ